MCLFAFSLTALPDRIGLPCDRARLRRRVSRTFSSAETLRETLPLAAGEPPSEERVTTANSPLPCLGVGAHRMLVFRVLSLPSFLPPFPSWSIRARRFLLSRLYSDPTAQNNSHSAVRSQARALSRISTNTPRTLIGAFSLGIYRSAAYPLARAQRILSRGESLPPSPCRPRVRPTRARVVFSHPNA